MRAVLKGLDSADVRDLDKYSPDDPECFGFYLEASFGPEGSPGEELFGIMVCTPRWLENEVRENNGILIGRHYLIVDRYDFGRLKRFLADYASQCEGSSWEEVAAKVARLGRWEFEDYGQGN
jgi:immunity protein 8 of polymorphic toxin system